MAKLLEGKSIAEKIKEQIRQDIQSLGLKPVLASIQVGDNAGAEAYAFLLRGASQVLVYPPSLLAPAGYRSVAQRSNGVAPMYVTVEDKAGKKKTVVNPDAAAVTKGAWTQWKIPLADLSGVNVAAVKKLTLGVGDNVNPKAGAAGMLFIDDIQFGKAAVVDSAKF